MNILDSDEKPNGGFFNSVSNGKTSVRNYIYVANKYIPIDIRYIGDKFFDINLQRKMLQNRTKFKNFYVPDKETHLFSLIYHALVHKNNISNNYTKFFLKYGITNISNKNLKKN